ncbi:MAG: pseudouridine-5'-phosphate glycosidase [Defluviitaleaceae bacterium]|nr:pseudouridine-5'-phosphate glycosidase [Defluviitaleaceae bacterium]
MQTDLGKYMDIQPEVADALAAGRPVVALETTIVFHGMPYPKNIECHNRCEEILRSKGVVPAAIAVHRGRIKIGLTPDIIREMLDSGDVTKLSRRDLPHVVAQGKSGATTVAATMIAAEMAGILVFATGGIGGVHRGGHTSFDISADLQQLAQSNVCVVCAGAKSILDIGLTLEYLETMGVPVLGWQTDEFPAFYTQRSGFKADYNMSGGKDIAAMLAAKWDMGLRGGAVVACPVPAAYAMDETAITQAIDQALAEAGAKGIHGKLSTPFLLAKVSEVTGGASLATNMQLVWNNCEKAADIAIQLENTPSKRRIFA